MGQKIHPLGFRLGFNKQYHSIWFARSNITRWCWLLQDKLIRDYLYTTYSEASIKQIDIHRYQPRRELVTDLFSDYIQIYISAGNPMIIHKTQTEKEDLINKLQKICEKPQVLTSWIPRPMIQIKYDLIPLNNTIHQAYGIADDLIEALEKRTRFRQALKKTISKLQDNPPKSKPRSYNRKENFDQRPVNQSKGMSRFDSDKKKQLTFVPARKQLKQEKTYSNQPNQLTQNRDQKITKQKSSSAMQKKPTKKALIASNLSTQKKPPLLNTAKKSVSPKKEQDTKNPTLKQKNQINSKLPYTQQQKKTDTTRIKLKKRTIHYKRITVENLHKRKQRFNYRFISPTSQKRREKKLLFLKGVRIQLAGRLNGAEMARVEWYKQGRVPLQTLRANIDYVSKTAQTTHGILGIKVWTYHGEQSTLPLIS
jgi:ribosomal protein S3